MGGMAKPAAFMHGSIVMLSRLFDTRPGTVTPTRAQTFVG
jgi:hypothetical protein